MADDSNNSTGLITHLTEAVAARRGVLTALVILIGLGLTATAVWRQAVPNVRLDTQYQVNAASLVIPTAPAWVKGDIASEALRNAGLEDSLSILDPPSRLEEPIADALRSHLWVRSVGHITKTPPNRLQIEIEYRKPVAALMRPGASPLLLDAEAVVLPPDGFSANEVSYLPRIRPIKVAAPPALGQHWTDPRIAGATALIAAIGEAWHELDLFEVQAHPTPEVRGAKRCYLFEIRTTGDTRIDWGAAPGFAPEGESGVSEKLARLRSFVARYGPLNSVSNSPEAISVRTQLKARRRIVKNDSPDGPTEEIVK